MEEARQRVLSLTAGHSGPLAHADADDQFWGIAGESPNDKLIDASIQWAERIIRRIDSLGS
jgi:hypothetical protein